ncbi:MAG: hypothetical protein ACE5H7_11790 [Acidiferrobacterales bacterium]
MITRRLFFAGFGRTGTGAALTIHRVDLLVQVMDYFLANSGGEWLPPKMPEALNS